MKMTDKLAVELKRGIVEEKTTTEAQKTQNTCAPDVEACSFTDPGNWSEMAAGKDKRFFSN
ncbi:MAG: hypothetical protein R6V06_10305 [Kiritimatiellia bacterium]